jgi:hypothetical protein
MSRSIRQKSLGLFHVIWGLMTQARLVVQMILDCMFVRLALRGQRQPFVPCLQQVTPSQFDHANLVTHQKSVITSNLVHQ